MTNAVSHLCGFADTTNTGVPTGTTLYAVPGQITAPTGQTGSGWTWNAASGDIQTTANNAVIKDISCSCEVVFNSSTGGTLENSDITDPNGTSDLGAVVLRHATNTTVKHNNIHGRNQTTGESGQALRDVYGDSENLTFEYNDVWYCADGLNNILQGGLIEGNYIHDMGTDSTSHYEDIQLEVGDGHRLTIQNNTFFNQHSQTAAIILSNDGGGTETNRVINHNLLAGGGYTVYGAGGSSTPSTNITFTNNSFSPLYYPKSGYYGPVAYWTSGRGNVWSGNIWDNNATSVAP